MNFFIEPREEIEPVISAVSTLKQGEKAEVAPMWLRVVVWAGIMIAVVAGVVIPTAVLKLGPPGAQHLVIVGSVMTIMSAIGAAYVDRRLFGFRHTCTYVGEFGLQLSVANGPARRDIHTTVLRYAEAVKLKTWWSDQQYRKWGMPLGKYSHSELEFKWFDASGNLLFGQDIILDKNAAIPEGHPYHFLSAAEYAWSMYMLPKVEETVGAGGTVRFEVKERGTVVMGPGFIEFKFEEGTTRLSIDQIQNLILRDREFDIRSVGRERFKFKYGKMANAKLFVLSVERICGLVFED
jgi:hypothetical protein